MDAHRKALRRRTRTLAGSPKPRTTRMVCRRTSAGGIRRRRADQTVGVRDSPAMPATDWKEAIADDETTRFEEYAAFFARLQSKSAVDGAPSRALHAKANLGVVAELEVLTDIAADAKVGMFAEPKTYHALVRYSNGAARRQA